MDVLITGACGFVGSALAAGLRASRPAWRISGVDNFARPGSETNRRRLPALGVRLCHGDVRAASDLEALPAADWVIDAAANPSVLAGVDGLASSRQAVEHNLGGTINLLEHCRRRGAGLTLLSTSRVYSIPALAALPLEIDAGQFRLRPGAGLPEGVSERGVSEGFSVAPPVSLYGATKLASETLALEYGASLGLPVWVNRCGVLAGAGQFGRADQGILAYWINGYRRRRSLRFIGFGGAGAQVRDALHPADLLDLILRQLDAPASSAPRVMNAGGGPERAFSLAGLHRWCGERFGFDHPAEADPAPRPFDIPWMLTDNARAAAALGWSPRVPLAAILEEIARHAEAHPDWLALSA